MPLATVWGSTLVNRAASALLEGSSWLVGGAPGMGGRRLKSGGITSGALVVTANSSGDFLFRPAALRTVSQPLSTTVQRPNAKAAFNNFISNLMAIGRYPLVFGRMFGLQHIIQDGHGPQGDRQVGYIEDIPVIAEAVKVEKIGHLAVDHPVHQIIAQGAADNQAIADGQGMAGGAPQKPAQHDDCHHRQADQQESSQLTGGGKQAVGDARVPHHHQIKKGQDRHGLARRHTGEPCPIEHEQLGPLVGGQCQGGGDQPDLARLEPGHAGPTLPTASVQRLHRWVSARVSSSTRQQRAHLSPEAFTNRAAAPLISGTAYRPSRLAATSTEATEVMAISARSTESNNALSDASLTPSTGAASSDEPMVLSARASSSAPVTTRRSSRTRVHFLTSSALVHSAGAGK